MRHRALAQSIGISWCDCLRPRVFSPEIRYSANACLACTHIWFNDLVLVHSAMPGLWASVLWSWRMAWHHACIYMYIYWTNTTCSQCLLPAAGVCYLQPVFATCSQCLLPAASVCYLQPVFVSQQNGCQSVLARMHGIFQRHCCNTVMFWCVGILQPLPFLAAVQRDHVIYLVCTTKLLHKCEHCQREGTVWFECRTGGGPYFRWRLTWELANWTT